MKPQRIFALLLSSILLLGTISGCQGTANVNRTLPEYSEDDIIYRAAWWCPEPTSENYDTYKESGLNTVMLVNHNFFSNTENYWELSADEQLKIMQEQGYYIGTPKGFEGETMTDKSLALAKEKGLSVILAEGAGYFSWIGQEVNVYQDFTIDYDEYEDIIVGVFSGDEPSAPEIKEQAKNIGAAQKAFPNVPYFPNLFPCYADATKTLKTDSYYKYLEEYGTEFLAKTSGPRMISVDFYPFIGANCEKWLYNYELFTDTALEYDADMNMFIQSCVSGDGSHRLLDEKEIRVQVNTALAYGADSYSYFLYTPAGEGYPEGLVDKDGKPASMYYYAQKVNAETASLENAYLHYDYVNTIPVTDDENDYSTGAFVYLPIMKNTGTCEESEILEEVTSTNRALVTILRDEDGNEAFYLTNYFDNGDLEMDEDCTITLSLKGMKKAALYGTTECLEGKTTELSKGTFEYTLKPGEGILVVPFKK